MFARVTTVAFEGIEARAVDVQVQIGPGLPHFAIVGLPDSRPPGDSVTPGGSEPLCSEWVSGSLPPVATMVCE